MNLKDILGNFAVKGSFLLKHLEERPSPFHVKILDEYSDVNCPAVGS